YVRRMRLGRPLVRCKLGMTLDGRTATAGGESQWITGPEARQDVQRLRARSSAVMTGIGTLLDDDPRLNVRIESSRQPVRVVVDSSLRTPPQATVLNGPGEVLIYCAEADRDRQAVLEARGATIIRTPAEEQVDLRAMLADLARRQVNEVLLEAGATLAGAMVQAGLVDELIVYMAPSLLGSAGRGLLNLDGIEHLAQAVELEIADIRRVGRDWRITAMVSGAETRMLY
ncbi:MAG TPA: bifunctional diaminohydroxyphosphoribosylaminopyrimidine deaminase/5-amino-6-(5-phosphoribosylamino)uracil reductase RibD, partial [Chromatiales bacterium]|nr:bifunctional diaminohydroxyphosphoribosylaminopyrimidine deaminase/5-amino-6-(5-phosphoribosylamino)uracil reductase RibD [Chromatiales bacterium]